MHLARPIEPAERRGAPPGAARAGRYSEGWAWVRVRGAFAPERIEARPGERLRLVFRREETAACSERVVVPSLGRSVMLPPFEDVAVDFGPMPTGDHEFHCGLGVLSRRIVVASSTERCSGVATEVNAGASADDETRPSSYVASEDTNRSARKEGNRMKRPTINITPAERIGRILVGLVGAVGGLLLLGSTAGALATVLVALMILAGLDLVVTGALGHCPLYRKLGYTPPSLRGAS